MSIHLPDLSARLHEGAAKLGIELTDQQNHQLLQHLSLLNKWNKTYNLTTISEPSAALVRHTLDSLAIQPWLKGLQLADLGSGGGFPGLPLAICNADRHFVLIDSRGKKVNFLNAVRRNLQLENLSAVHGRVEDFRPTQQFDTLVSRAFTSLESFIRLSRHLLKSGGQWLAMKGEYPDAELEALHSQQDLTVSCVPLSVPELDAERHLVIITLNP